MAKWLAKLMGLVPGWLFFSRGRNITGLFSGMSALLSGVEENLSQHINETRVGRAEGQFLDLLGAGRGVFRRPNESDDAYRLRVRSVSNLSNCRDIRETVETLLRKKGAVIIEDFAISNFMDRQTFAGRNSLVIGNRARNAFTLSIPSQIASSVSFMDRRTFFDRGAVSYHLTAPLRLYRSIVQFVNSAKAFAVLWRFIVRT